MLGLWKDLKKNLGADNSPMVIVTDRELALMNAITLVFPQTAHLLCLWHIQQNVLTNCKKFFEKDEDFEKFLSTWTDMMYTIDESSFYDKWNLLEEHYKDKPLAIEYIKKNWLPYKERLVFVWVESHMHFGNHVSSKAEGAHSTLKKYLQVSTGNLREAKTKICLAIENQVKEIKTKVQSERIRTSHSFRIPLFHGLVGNISKHALEKLLEQYELASSDKILDKCRGHFQSIMGLPCAHKLRNMLKERIDFIDIHPQWRIDGRSFESLEGELCYEDDQFATFLKNFQEKCQKMPLSQRVDTQKHISQLVDAPLALNIQARDINPCRGRLLGSKKRKNVSSIRRDLCGFEIVERNRKCSTCGDLGHDTHSCKQMVDVNVLTPSMYCSQDHF